MKSEVAALIYITTFYHIKHRKNIIGKQHMKEEKTETISDFERI